MRSPSPLRSLSLVSVPPAFSVQPSEPPISVSIHLGRSAHSASCAAVCCHSLDLEVGGSMISQAYATWRSVYGMEGDRIRSDLLQT